MTARVTHLAVNVGVLLPCWPVPGLHPTSVEVEWDQSIYDDLRDHFEADTMIDFDGEVVTLASDENEPVTCSGYIRSIGLAIRSDEKAMIQLDLMPIESTLRPRGQPCLA